MLVSVLLGLTLPLASKYLVDDVIASGSYHRLAVFIAVILLIYVLNGMIGIRGRYVANATNERMLLELQERLFAHLQRLPHRFYATAKVGDLMSRLSSDLQVVQAAIAMFAGNGLFLALTALAAAITLLVLNLLLGLLVLTVVPLFAISYLTLQTRFQTTSYEYHRLLGDVAAVTQENLSAQPVIKAFGLAERVVAAYHARLMALLNAFMRMSVIGSLFQASMSLATTLGQLVVLGVGGYLIIDDRLTVGTLLAFIGLLPSLFQPVAALSDVAQTVQQASAAMDRVSELLDQPITIADRAGAQPLPPLSREIRLEHITFGYESGRPIIHDLNLAIPAGASIAIVGPSGCGKSTLVNLLMRFYDPDAGGVCFDGHDLREVTLDSLRGQMGLVFQDTFVFDSTLRENIVVGRPDASDAEVAAATEAAQLADFVAGLPAGYDTVLGERGVRMSGGQRQRLAIARALVRDPRILILDEATSALDAQTERQIQATLAAAARGRTTISVTHRLTSAATADRIFVLDQGRLVEEGTHAQLVASAGLYHRLYEEQTGSAPRAESERDTIVAMRLQAIPLFASLQAENLASLADRLQFRQYMAGEDIVRQGDPGDRMYVIQHGQVEVVVAIDGGERRINTLTEGDFFGEMALLTGEPRTATVRTTIPTGLYTLAREDFASLLEEQPGIRRALLETIVKRRSAITAAISAAAFTAPGAST
jgi:ATP-binding cassette subfamily B protein